MCERQSELMLRVASLLPRLVIAGAHVRTVDGDLREVEVTVENHGYLPTSGMQHAKDAP